MPERNRSFQLDRGRPPFLSFFLALPKRVRLEGRFSSLLSCSTNRKRRLVFSLPNFSSVAVSDPVFREFVALLGVDDDRLIPAGCYGSLVTRARLFGFFYWIFGADLLKRIVDKVSLYALRAGGGVLFSFFPLIYQ